MADVECQETKGGQEKTTVQAENMDGDDSESDMEDIYEVEKIVDMTKSKGKTLYRVRWAGYGPDWDTWEPYDNLESCHHVIDQYMSDRQQLQEKEKDKDKEKVQDIEKVQEKEKIQDKEKILEKEKEKEKEREKEKEKKMETESVSVDGSDTDSVHSSASRKKKLKKPTYVYVEDEACDTLKDKFWRDLEQGKINVFGNDMYSKVKGQGRSSRPTSFSEMFKGQGLDPEQEQEQEEGQEPQDGKRTRKRVKRQNSSCSSSSVSGSVKSSEATRPKKSRRSSLTKQSSQDSENSVFAGGDFKDLPPPSTAAPTAGSKRGRPRRVKSESNTEPGGGDGDGGGGASSEGDGEDVGELVLSLSDQSSDCSSVKSEASSKGSGVKRALEERGESPVRERAPIVVIRRSADGNGYTQKLVEGRPRSKSQTMPSHSNSTKSSSPDDRQPTPKNTDEKQSPSRETPKFEDSIIKTEKTPPITMKITHKYKTSPDSIKTDIMSYRPFKAVSVKDAAPAVATSCEQMENKRSVSHHQKVVSAPRDELKVWARKDPKLASCYVPLFDVSVLGEAVSRQRQNSKECATKEGVSRLSCSPRGEGRKSNSPSGEDRKGRSPPRGGGGIKARSPPAEDTSGRPPLPVLRITASPPTCRCKTRSSSPPALNTMAMATCTVVETPRTQAPVCKSESPTSPPCTSPVKHTSPPPTTPIPCEPQPMSCSAPVTCSVSSSSLMSPTIKFEPIDSFVSSLHSHDEEIPGLGDILPLSLRPNLEPELLSSPLDNSDSGKKLSPVRTSGGLGTALPPIITCQPMSTSNLPMTSPPVHLDPTRQSLTQHNPSCALSQALGPQYHSAPQPSLLALSQSLLNQIDNNNCSGKGQFPTPQMTPDSYHEPMVPPLMPPADSHIRPPYPTPSPSQYSCSSSAIMSPYGHDPSVMSPAPLMEPISPHNYMMQQPSPNNPPPLMESPCYGGNNLEESCNQFNDVDMRLRGSVPSQLQQMSRSAGVPIPNTSCGAGRPTTGPYNPYSPHQGASPYSTSAGSPAAWSMSSPSPGTPGGPVGTPLSQGGSNANIKLLGDDTAFDFDLLEVDPGLWDQKHPSDKKTEPVDLTNLELKNAVRNNDYETVRRALMGRKKYDLEMRDDMGITLLMTAAARSHDDVLELLVLNSANINARSKNGSTALMFASENGHRCTVELLLIMGAHMNVQQASGDTALTKAVKNGNKHIVRLLLDHGSNFSSPSYINDLTAMKVAKQRNHYDIMEMLNKHISWVTADFENQVKITLNNTASINCALFPMQCFALAESDHITITFNHELQPTMPGVGMLLFIAHARITSSEVRCRFYGPCAVNAATLNGYQLHPLTEEANFVMSFSPLYNGRNDLEIKTVKAPTSRAKLVVCAYKAQLALPPD